MSDEFMERDPKVQDPRSQEKCEEKNSVNAAEASEGGWGYAIIIAFSIIQILMMGPTTSLGILFNDFLHGGGTQAVVMFITSMNMGIAVSGIGSFMTSVALKRFTFRQTALFGVLFIVFGDFFAIFMTAPYHLIITYGILRGFGLGILFCLCFVALNSYFVRKRTSMTSLSQISACLGGMIFPTLITALLEHYGFRGTMLIIFALDLHLISAALLLVPAKPSIRSFRAKIIRINDVESRAIDEQYESLKTLIDTNVSTPAVFESNNAKKKLKELKSSVWSRLVKLFNLHYLTDPIFVNIAFGLSLSFFSDGNFKMVESLILNSYPLDKSQVAICITAGGVADFASRIFMAIFTLYIKIGPRFLYFIGLSLTFLFRLAFLTSQNFIFLAVIMTIIGFVRSWMTILYSIIVADYVSTDQFPAAYGLTVMMTGIIMSVGGPITGIIHTVTGEYVWVVYALLLCNAINIITWMVEYFYTRIYKNIKK